MGGQRKKLAIEVVATLIHTVPKNWQEKKLANILFIDVKSAFDYVSRGQFLTQMIELRSDKDLVTWTKSFLTNRKVQLVINSNDNKEKKIETRILQGFLVLPILYLIYISGIFDKMLDTNHLVTFLSIVDNLGFIAVANLLKEVAKTFEIIT